MDSVPENLRERSNRCAICGGDLRQGKLYKRCMCTEEMKREKERERFARTDFAKIEDEMINITTLNYTCIRTVIILIIFPSN